jgi:putative transcriptional regulator
MILKAGESMSVVYKFDVLERLRLSGYTTYKIRKDKLLSESTVQKLRRGDGVSWENISTICALLNCQPGDLLEYVPDSADKGGE